MYILSPSALSADFARLGADAAEIEKAGAPWIHLDVMDGLFVPNISFGIPVIQSLRKASGLYFDVHLMIVDPIRYVKAFADAGADHITFHVEAAEDPAAVLKEIRKYGKKELQNVLLNLHKKQDFEKVQEVLGDDVDKGLLILEENR